MAVTTFVSELRSARLKHALEKSLVAANLVNKDYEGEIRQQGDTVHINNLSPITIRTYTAGTDITVEDLATTDVDLEITEADYYAFKLEDIDAAQAAGELIDVAMGRAAYGLADDADAYIIGTMASEGTAVETVASMTTSNIYSSIVKIRTKLDKANVPTTGRWLLVDPDAYALLLQDTRFINGSEMGAERYTNGYVGKVAGFDVYMSNNIVKKMIGGVAEAVTYAEQITKTEAYRPEGGFQDAVKGLHVYGAKVTRPAAVQVTTITAYA